MMTVVPCLIAFAVGLGVSIACFVRTPDPDRRRAYPRDEGLWSGITGSPASLRHAVGTGLFYALGATAFGAAGAICSVLMPGRPVASLAVALLVGVAGAVATSRTLLRAGPGAMQPVRRSSKAHRLPVGARPRVLFICGSPNQSTQMHQIARALPEVDAWFTPYFSDHWTIRLLVKLRWVDSTILGLRRRGICLDYLNAHHLQVDLCAERNDYDLCVSCNDQVLPKLLDETPWILVQEGVQEPPNWRTRLWRITRVVPAPLTGTATFGLSDRYTRFCVASDGYRRRYLAEGISPDKLVVTGIPNFDDFARHTKNDFPHRGYVLVCTSDARETWLAADRKALLRQAVEVAAGRPLLFKLHPNERVDRATREIAEVAPDALVFSRGSAEDMVANCDVLLTEWSSVTFCGVALGKEVHSYHSLDEIRDLLPLQSGRAAEDIAGVVRALLDRPAGTGEIA